VSLKDRFTFLSVNYSHVATGAGKVVHAVRIVFVCVYLYICMYMCMYMYIFMYIYLCICIYICMELCGARDGERSDRHVETE